MTQVVARPELARLAAEVGAHLERVHREAAEVERLISAGDPAGDVLWVVASHLHGFYNGVESILRLLAVALDSSAPEGPDSHARLVAVAALEVPSVRPAILSAETATALRPYLAFRHFFRHAYGATLRWDKMKDKATGIRDAHARFTADIEAFRAALLLMAGVV